MNRRSLFRSLIGLPLLPFAAKAAEPLIDPIRVQLMDSTTVQFVYPATTKWHYVQCTGAGGGGAAGMYHSCAGGGGGAGCGLA